MCLGGLCLAPLVLIIANFVLLVGRSVVMVLRLDLVRVPLSFSWMSFWDSFVILLGVGVHYLLVLFSCGVVLLGLLTGPPLGGCQFPVTLLLIWSLPMLVLCGRLLLTVLVRRFTGLVVLSWTEKISTKQKNSCTPRVFYGSISSTGLEEVASCLTFQFFHS